MPNDRRARPSLTDDPAAGLLGLPLASSAVARFLAAAGCRPAKPPPRSHHDDVYTLGSDARGVLVELVRSDVYSADFATPTTARRGWVVAGVDLLGDRSNVAATRAYKPALPFGLVFGDHGDDIIAKVGRRPSSREPGTGYPHAWWWNLADRRFLAALDARTRLRWLRIVPRARR